METKKIALVGTYYEESHGDALLFDCVKYLYSDIAKKKNIKLDFKIVDILGKTSIKKNNSNIQNKKDKIYKYIKIPFVKKIYSSVKSKLKMKKLYQFYLDNIKNIDMLVIAGGGLFKYSVRTNFAPIFNTLIKAADYYNIPVIFNAIGIEGEHKENNKNYQILKKAINNKNVKMVSTRDQIEILEKYIDNPNIIVKKVIDTGIWTFKAMDSHKNNSSNIIGLNVITPSRFIDYNKIISEDELLSFWSKIINRLKEKKYSFSLYTNGLKEDYDFAKKVLKYCNLNEKYLAANPANQHEMVDNICKYKAIIANRLHSCIAAYSLDIPAIGIAWNNKLLYWAKSVNLEKYFFDFNQLDINLIIDRMEELIREGYDLNKKDEYLNNIYEFIEQSFDCIK